jgi:hypothetical protein
MVKRKKNKLTLSLETVRQLSPDEVRPAAGGCISGTVTQYVTCLTCHTHCRC